MDNLKQIINADLFRYGKGINKSSFIKNFMINYGFKYTYFLRKTKYYKSKNKFLYVANKVILKKLSVKYGYDINEDTDIGYGLYINHFGGIVINKKCKIGNNVNLTKGVTIGQANRGINKGCPTIGNEVWIGSNAVVVGAVSVGNNVLIAPNAYVNFDVPNDSIVIGNPAKIINKENATDSYINNIFISQ